MAKKTIDLTPKVEQITEDQLKNLHLSQNNFEVFPSVILGFTNIKEIYLSRNKLTELPIEAIKSCSSLSLLSLDGNLFTPQMKEYIQDQLGYWFGEL